ncbi:MAG: hypothetical protein M5U28_24005 [Sandaracinaceae bacterium]|nr:hypothetical protein [Sandaracinaceae bacterium]
MLVEHGGSRQRHLVQRAVDVEVHEAVAGRVVQEQEAREAMMRMRHAAGVGQRQIALAGAEVARLGARILEPHGEVVTVAREELPQVAATHPGPGLATAQLRPAREIDVRRAPHARGVGLGARRIVPERRPRPRRARAQLGVLGGEVVGPALDERVPPRTVVRREERARSPAAELRRGEPVVIPLEPLARVEVEPPVGGMADGVVGEDVRVGWRLDRHDAVAADLVSEQRHRAVRKGLSDLRADLSRLREELVHHVERLASERRLVVTHHDEEDATVVEVDVVVVAERGVEIVDGPARSRVLRQREPEAHRGARGRALVDVEVARVVA